MADVNPQLKRILDVMKLDHKMADKKVTPENAQVVLGWATEARRNLNPKAPEIDINHYGAVDSKLVEAAETGNLSWNQMFQILGATGVDAQGRITAPSNSSNSLAGMFADYATKNPNGAWMKESLKAQITGDFSYFENAPKAAPRPEPKGAPGWLPPPPNRRRDELKPEAIPISIDEALNNAGVQRAILARDDLASPPPDVRTNRPLEI